MPKLKEPVQAQNVLNQLLSHKALASLCENLDREEVCTLDGIPLEAQAFVISAWSHLHPKRKRPVLLVAPTIKWQEEIAHNLEVWDVPHLFYPETLELNKDTLPDPDLQSEKVAVLSSITSEIAPIILTTSTALTQPTPSPEQIISGKLVLKKGSSIPLDHILAKLAEAGYIRETLVVERGQFTHRGGIVDCFSWQSSFPVRIEWMGDEIESIREFDPAEQTSIRHLEEVEIQLCPISLDQEFTHTLESFFPDTPKTIHLGEEIGETKIEEEFFSNEFLHGAKGDLVISENRRKLLIGHILDWLKEGRKLLISCNNEGEWGRLVEWLRETPEIAIALDLEEEKSQIHFFISPMLRGFSYPACGTVLLADAEIFGRYQTLRVLRKQQRAVERRKSEPIDFSNLELGDYVVHLEHGIALYLGTQELPSEDGKTPPQQVLALEFHGGSKLYVPIEQAYLVSKYVGVGKAHPALDTLGGTRWEKARKHAQKAVMDYAAQLLRVQAERETLSGHPCSPDTPWQMEFEKSFIHNPTADQLKAIVETKVDMESARPMDRLICGDVGFGKTEVAIRAAFKAVMGGKQVAFLVPTTVLAHQHWNTLRERMADYPVTVDVLSRFRTKGEQKATIEKVAAGEVDIVVGTHRLISSDVSFKNLGLVIIDEEQRFGVKQKEKLKNQFRLVDVLTLSATPIPRTLYLSLLGARDMSTIETAPPNRLPVETTVSGYDERLIRSVIDRELNRGGQVYFLHNRVQSIYSVAEKLKLLIPKARIEVGHGQMDDDDLERVMGKFVHGECDILLSTTIIESGLDIPNANTIIIDRADRFGLADLYQLRGRVGRSQNRAYALLLLPRDLMKTEAKKRVQAIREYSQLGAGYKIAMRDLEIRGAGNILGTAQSGHITAVGFELYCRLLKLAVAQMKGQSPVIAREVYMNFDFISLRDDGQNSPSIASACIPASYMSETKWRITAYRELAELQNLNQWDTLRKRWKDRFGKWPEPTELLLNYHKIRILSSEAGFERVEVVDNKVMIKKNSDFVMIGAKFPRLTKEKPKPKLKQLELWIESFAKSSASPSS